MRASRGFGPHYDVKWLAECPWEEAAIESESLVCENQLTDSGIQSTTRHVEPCGKTGGPPPKAKYSLVTDSA